MKNVIIQSLKVTLGVGALAAALTGCCMFGKGKCCDKCCKDPCACCCKDPCACCCKGSGTKTSGVNTSMTVGVGTDGIYVGGDANVGNHGVSVGAGGSVR